MISDRLSIKGYDCTKCQRTHFDFESVYAHDIMLQSKHGITNYSPFAVAQVVDDQAKETNGGR